MAAHVADDKSPRLAGQREQVIEVTADVQPALGGMEAHRRAQARHLRQRPGQQAALQLLQAARPALGIARATDGHAGGPRQQVHDAAILIRRLAGLGIEDAQGPDSSPSSARSGVDQTTRIPISCARSR